MKQASHHKDTAVILSRVDYGERDRILTVLTRNSGKISLLAKGVRSEKSRLAGGIELLSESHISYIEGRTDLKPLTSARLIQHFSKIPMELTRMQQAFEHIRIVNSIAEEGSGQEYFDLLIAAMAALNENEIDSRLVEIWFNLHILNIFGAIPSLEVENVELDKFKFDYDQQCFVGYESGAFSKNDLKLLRICIMQNKPPKLSQPLGSEDRLVSLTRVLLKTNVTEI